MSEIYYEGGQSFTDDDLNRSAIQLITGLRRHLRGRVYHSDTKKYTYKNHENHNERIIEILKGIRGETHKESLEIQRAISILTAD